MIGCSIIGITPGIWAKAHDYSHFHSFMLKQKVERKFVCSSGLAIRCGIYERVGGFNPEIKVAEDEDLGMRVSEIGKKIIYLPSAKIYHNHGRNSAKLFFHHPYFWAVQGSILPYLKYSQNKYNKFASKNPWYYLLMSPIISAIVSAKICKKLMPVQPKVILYFPLIFLNKFAWCIGTYKFLSNKSRLGS
jgi:GT2 family glycosyltransferase